MKRFYIPICIGSIAIVLAVFGFLTLKLIEGRSPETTHAKTPSKFPKQFSLTKYQENKAVIRETYPALPFLVNQRSDELAVRQLNMAIETVKKSLERNGEAPKSTEDILAYLNSLYQKWGDPRKGEALIQQTKESLQTAKASIQRLEFESRKSSDLKDQIKEEFKAFLTKRRELLSRLDEQAVKLDALSDRPRLGHSELDDEDRNMSAETISEKTKGTTSPDISSQERLIPPSFASQETWHDHIASQVASWNADFDERYLDVIIAPYLKPEEFEVFFPTEVSRQRLQSQQQQMQSEIAKRVEELLSNDTPRNRAEKLSIIRQTLSENWSPEIAESVLEQLR